MKNTSLGIDPNESSEEFNQIAIDYKLKMIAFQNEIFQSRKKLQDSDRKMADLQKRLDEYVRNKENQIAEVMFTAHMNAQRIEAQTRSNTEFILQEMEEEMRRKEQEMGLLQQKTSTFVSESPSDGTVGQENIARLQTVQNTIRELREQDADDEVKEVITGSEAAAEKPQESKPRRVLTIKMGQRGQKQVVAVTEMGTETGPADSIDMVNGLNQSAWETDEHTKDTADTTPMIEAQNSIELALPDKTMQDGDAGKVIVADQDQEQPAAQLQNLSAESPGQTESIPESGIDDLHKAANKVEPNEHIRLDVFVDARYYNSQKQMEHHALQITIEVEVPSDNYSVRYTKVSSDVVSTLMKYDNVTLNDIYPFNILEPNTQNIALYFYNCLEDMLSFMDLKLYCLTMIELPDLQVKITTRNTQLDNYLHGGVDVLGDIRESLVPCVEDDPQEDKSSLKGRLGKILNRRY